MAYWCRKFLGFAIKRSALWPVSSVCCIQADYPLVTAPHSRISGRCRLHTSAVANEEKKQYRWLLYNEDKFPIQSSDEKPRPAYVCHAKFFIIYSHFKLWYVAQLIRGMKIDDALNQLKFIHKKGGIIVRDVLLEAQKLAVKEHYVEYPSNLWVAESFVTKGGSLKGYRRHAKRRYGEVRTLRTHYFVRLEEGDPPEHYYHFSRKLTPQELLEQWLDDRRKRTILYSL